MTCPIGSVASQARNRSSSARSMSARLVILGAVVRNSLNRVSACRLPVTVPTLRPPQRRNRIQRLPSSRSHGWAIRSNRSRACARASPTVSTSPGSRDSRQMSPGYSTSQPVPSRRASTTSWAKARNAAALRYLPPPRRLSPPTPRQCSCGRSSSEVTLAARAYRMAIVTAVGETRVVAASTRYCTAYCSSSFSCRLRPRKSMTALPRRSQSAANSSRSRCSTVAPPNLM